MSPILALRSIARLEPGLMLDIGARDGAMARYFAEIGYTVEAIEPNPLEEADLPEAISFQQTTLEEFRADKRYDLVVASLISHLVRYDIPTFLARLKSLAKEDGLVYVTLLGDQDAWAPNPFAKAMTFEEACALMAGLGLTPLYRSIEWLEGRVYSGEPKSWHLYQFIVSPNANGSGAISAPAGRL